jgi:hypothetical protein
MLIGIVFQVVISTPCASMMSLLLIFAPGKLSPASKAIHHLVSCPMSFSAHAFPTVFALHRAAPCRGFLAKLQEA